MFCCANFVFSASTPTTAQRDERDCPALLISYGEATLSKGEGRETGKWKRVKEKRKDESIQASEHSTITSLYKLSPIHARWSSGGAGVVGSGQSGGRVGKGDESAPEFGASSGGDESGGSGLGVLAEAA
jgi:hypothetical protein